MRIRFKLLILLMLISLTPLLVVRASVQRDLTRMGDALAKRSANLLVHKASNGLKRIVEDHARVLKTKRQLLESTSLLLASKLEGVLYGHAHTPMDREFSLSDSAVNEAGKEYYMLHMRGERLPLGVDFTKVSLEGGAGGRLTADHLVPLLGEVKFRYPELILWIGVSLPDGSKVVYPKVSGRSMMGGRMGDTNEPGLKDEFTWDLPRQDQYTRRMVFRVTAPIRDVTGNVQGNLFIIVPVDAILHENQHVGMFSDNAESLLVQSAAGPDGVSGLRIIAEEQSRQAMSGHWQVAEEEQWLSGGDAEQLGLMTAGLLAQKAGVVGMKYKGEDALWAYSPIGEGRISLILVVPRDDIVRDALAARDYVLTQVDEHNGKMGLLVFAVAGLVLLIALLLSKLFTRNISGLAAAVRNVAKGNFTVRAPVRSTDEIGQLALAFNKMVPELQERVAMKNSLEVAQEVQQSLLPSKNPSFAGADLAATSSYCDETGGDYYGFIPRRTEAGESLVVAVGDVSGHGIPAAMMMASARAYLRSQASGRASLEEVVTTVNRLICEDVDGSGRFMTLFLLELTGEHGAQWVRAGHDPALLYDPETDRFEELVGEGLPLGVTDDARFDINRRSDLQAGQMIIIGTDGIWEMHSESGEMFGKERLKALIREHAQGTSAQLIDALTSSLAAFQGAADQLDDITIAAIKIG